MRERWTEVEQLPIFDSCWKLHRVREKTAPLNKML